MLRIGGSYFFDLTADPLDSMLLGLAFDGVLGGAALFGLPISMEDLTPRFFVLGSPFGGGGATDVAAGGRGACFFAVLLPLHAAAAAEAWTCCLQLACDGVQTMPLMITPLRIVSLLTLSLLSGRSSWKGSIGPGLFTLLGGVGLNALAGGCGGGCGSGGGRTMVRAGGGEMGRVVISSTASSMT